MFNQFIELITFGKRYLFTSLIYFGVAMLILSIAPIIASLNPHHQSQNFLICETPEYHFGEIQENDFPEHTFLLKNQGKKVITIRRVMPGCGFCIHVVDFTRNAISPGREGFVKLQLLTGSLQGNVSKEVIVKTDAPKSPDFLLVLHASIKEEQ